MTENRSEKRPENSLEAVITVKLTPRSSKNEFVGIMENGTIKIRLTAPPVDGKANQALIGFISEKLDISMGKIKILSGQTSHTKMISILGMPREEIIKRIQEKCN
jgi:uncharacterized protein